MVVAGKDGEGNGAKITKMREGMSLRRRLLLPKRYLPASPPRIAGLTSLLLNHNVVTDSMRAKPSRPGRPFLSRMRVWTLRKDPMLPGGLRGGWREKKGGGLGGVTGDEFGSVQGVG